MALTGYLYKQICYPSASAFIDSFNSEYAYQFNGVHNTCHALQSASGFTQNCMATYNGYQYQEITNDLYFVLPRCDPAVSLTGATIFDPVMAGAVWMFAITMVLGVWVLAKNAGIIIDMVRRW